jgi:hypothetical protein
MLGSAGIMKRCVGSLCGAFSLLALASPAFADDAPAGASLQAGGLKPPEAVPSEGNAPGANPTEAKLDLADKEDSGRGLEFVWLNAEVGPEFLGLATLRDKGLVDRTQVDSKHAGMVYGAGLGMRLLVFTFGARFRFGNFPDWQLWTLNAEAGMHIPLGRVEPYLTLGGGYASLGGFDKAKVGPNFNNAHGFDVRAGFGVDVYLTNTFSVGGNLTGEALFLHRSAGAPDVGGPTFNIATTASTDGSGIGVGGTLSAVLGLHF